MNANEFDLDFDFEKEYGFDPPKEEEKPQNVEDFDLSAILESDFGDEAPLFSSEYTADFDYGPESEDLPLDEDPEPDPVASEREPAGEAFSSEEPPAFDFEEEPEAVISTEAEAPQEQPVRRQRRQRSEMRTDSGESDSSGESRRRKPMSPMRRFKNEQLPKLILGATAIVMAIFIIGSVSRAISTHLKNRDDRVDASNEAKTKEQQELEQVQTVLREAQELATGYDYDGAIAMLESFKQSFTGDITKYQDVDTRLSSYNQAKSQLVAHNDPGAITNLSFNVLIADPARAFNDSELGGKYNMNFVTTDEFQRILEQLYANNYVLVDMDCFITETSYEDGSTSLSAKTLYLPDGKKPIMITETLANYPLYMIDSDDDGVADKDGAGFASRLVLQNGQIKAEMVNSAGETVVGDYDLVPILESFIEEHPDFSYQGARAILATTGEEGVFGYRINKSVIESKGQAYYDEQVAGAKKIADALRDAGYEIACHTYSFMDYSAKNATEIKADIDKWTSEIVSVIGEVDTIVYIRNTDIQSAGTYTGNKYNVLDDAGFRFFISGGSKSSANVTTDYVRQNRVTVSGTQMAHTATMYTNFFDAKAVLNSQRGDVPQS